jgi:hypothetical protein
VRYVKCSKTLLRKGDLTMFKRRDTSSSKGDPKKDTQKTTTDNSKPKSKMPQWLKPSEPSSYVDKTSVKHKPTSSKGSISDSLKGQLEQDQDRKIQLEKERNQNIAKLSSTADKYFSNLVVGTGESSRDADVSERTIKHRELILSVDQFRQYLTSESSFIASQVSNVLESRRRDDTKVPLTIQV